jgi:hypothetical protein
MTSSRWRPRSTVVGCAWFVALSTVLTIHLSSRDLELTVENVDTFNTYYGYGYKPAGRLPRSHEHEDEYNNRDDFTDTKPASNNIVSSSEELSKTSADGPQIIKQDGYTDLQLSGVNTSAIEDKIYWSPLVESLVPVGELFRLSLNLCILRCIVYSQ